MTPKQKAKELINRFYISFPLDDFNKERYIFVKKHAKNCALIAVDEIINISLPSSEYGGVITDNTIEYWQEVKQEIQEL
jgi:hypothetical protein